MSDTKKAENAKEKSDLLEEDAEFLRMLKVYFVKTCNSKYSEIVSSLKEGDINNAYRLAHTLKGNAAQLGKSFLKEAAANVESNLKNDSNNVTNEQLMVLKTELEAVLSEFKKEQA